MDLFEDEAFLQEHFCKSITVKKLLVCKLLTKNLKIAMGKNLVRVHTHKMMQFTSKLGYFYDIHSKIVTVYIMLGHVRF